MSLRENWKAVQERDRQQPEADGANHRRYAKAWELHKLGVPVMSPNGGPDPAFTEAALDQMLVAERDRRARLYTMFVRAGTVTIFQALGVQILAGDDTVYTIGNHDPLVQTNSSRPLGLLAGAEAMVTDGLQVRRPGRYCCSSGNRRDGRRARGEAAEPSRTQGSGPDEPGGLRRQAGRDHRNTLITGQPRM